MGRILAAADIGSNTVHLLVAEVEDGLVSRLSDANEWVSLGEVVGRLGKVPPAVVDRLIKSLDTFRRAAISMGAEAMYVFGTEALRKAENQKRVLDAIRVATGIQVDLIPGTREAKLGLLGDWLDSDGDGPFLICEVGGGSAQIAHCLVDEGLPWIDSEVSLPLGTGTLIAKVGIEEPCAAEQYRALEELVTKAIDGVAVGENRRMVACGGVIRGLWRALHPDGEREIAVEELDYLIWATRQLTLDVIVDRFQVKPKRAATLLPGAVVYRSLLAAAGLDRLTVSRFGVREGAILELAAGNIKASRLVSNLKA